MSNNEENNGTSEIQVKHHFGGYDLTLKNIISNEVSTVTFQLTDSMNRNVMNLELSSTNFDLLMRSLNKFATILKESDPKTADTPPPRPRQARTEFTDFF